MLNILVKPMGVDETKEESEERNENLGEMVI